MMVRDLRPMDAAACDDIVRGLPHFFGSPAGLAMCAEAVRTQRGWVADDTGTVNGFLLVDYPLPSAPEITWMAVRAVRRRQGVGRTLLEHAVRALAGSQVLSVLTLAPSVRESGTDTYAGTRAFYHANGFLAVREIHPRGWSSAALLLVRPLAAVPTP